MLLACQEGRRWLSCTTQQQAASVAPPTCPAYGSIICLILFSCMLSLMFLVKPSTRQKLPITCNHICNNFANRQIHINNENLRNKQQLSLERICIARRFTQQLQTVGLRYCLVMSKRCIWVQAGLTRDQRS